MQIYHAKGSGKGVNIEKCKTNREPFFFLPEITCISCFKMEDSCVYIFVFFLSFILISQGEGYAHQTKSIFFTLPVAVTGAWGQEHFFCEYFLFYT